MREIKFRFRLKELTKEGYREWFEFYTLNDLIRGGGITTAEIIAKDLFTGLLDKNGKEIFEGDIYKNPKCTDGNGKEWIREIPKFPDKLFHLIGEGIFRPDEIEVIGNIWENKKLLT